ncbi:MAG: divalent-cation tolerance protein CutA [Chloracidobacterium sp.]|nr:divalent-cation tolerance protein CutA [Chloracidobacterium sp.]
MTVIIVLTTVSNVDEGETLAHAACVQILPQMTSIYIWEGKVQKENEYLVLIKTLPEKWKELRDLITANHSYEVPEIIAIDAAEVSEQYLDWATKTLV